MKFVVDASLPPSVVELLRSAGHEAQHVSAFGLGAADDRDIGEYSRAHRACLLTADFDFADLRDFVPRDYTGIVIFALPRWHTMLLIEVLVAEFLAQLDDQRPLEGKLLIVEPGRIRVRS